MSAAAVSLSNGQFILMDCGEGTIHQLFRTSLSLAKLSAILITHLHGDHFFGIYAVLTIMHSKGRKAPVVVVGPIGIRKALAAVSY